MPPSDRDPIALEPPARVAAAVGFVAFVVLLPLDAWKPLGACGLGLALVLGRCGLDPATLLVRWARVGLTLLVFALLASAGHPERARLGAGGVVAAIVAKNVLAMLAMAALAESTPTPRLLGALRKLGVPAVLVSILAMLDRYLDVFRDELERMARARRARRFRRGGKLDWGLLAGLIGTLFVRAHERGERVHAAMLARGWDGVIRTLDDGEGR